MLNEQKKTKGKTTKLLLRLTLGIGLFLLIFPFIIAGLLLIPSVQSFVLAKTVTYGGDYLGTRIELEGIRHAPYRHLELNGLCVYDQYDDTLLYVEEFRIGRLAFDQEAGELDLGNISLRNTYFQLYVPEDGANNNLQFIIDALSSEDTSSSTAMSINVDGLTVDQLRFKFDDYTAEHRMPGEIDFNHLDVRDLSGKINDLRFEDSLTAEVSGLHFREKSGFLLRCLDTEFSLSDRRIEANYLGVVINRSILRGSYSMRFDDWGAFSNFEEEVIMQASLVESMVHFKDLGYFAHQADGILTPVRFSIAAEGPLNDIVAEVRKLEFGDHASLRADDLHLRSVTDPGKLFIESKALSLQVAAADIEKLRLPKDDDFFYIQLPKVLHEQGVLQLEGSYRGSIEQFYYYGMIQTPHGNLTTKSELNLEDGAEHYEGWVSSESLNLAQISGTQELGVVAFRAEFIGDRFDFEKMSAQLKGKIKSAEAYGHRYSAIAFDVDLKDQKITYDVDIADPVANLGGSGLLDFSRNRPSYVFNGSIRKLDLAGTLPGNDSLGVISGDLDVSIIGTDPVEMEGMVSLKNFSYTETGRSFHLETLELIDRKVTQGHEIELQSDYVSAHFLGNVPVVQLPQAALEVLHRYAPELIPSIDADSTKDRYCEFNITVEKEKELIAFFDPKLATSTPIHLSGRFSTGSGVLEVHSDSMNWSYGEAHFKRLVVDVATTGSGILGDISMSSAELSESYFLEGLTLQPLLSNDTLSLDVFWNNNTTQADSGAFGLIAYPSAEYPINLELKHMFARVAGVAWKSSKPASLAYGDDVIIVRDLDIRSNRGYIACHGEINPNNQQRFEFEVSNLELNYLSNFGLLENQLFGTIDAAAVVRSSAAVTLAEIDMVVDSFVVDSFEIGHLEALTYYNTEREGLEVDAVLDYRGVRNVTVKGMYYPKREVEQLNLKVGFTDFRARIIEPFIQNYASNIDGRVDGSIQARGSLAAPSLQGALTLSEMSGNVAYLNTAYRIPSARIDIEPDFIAIDYAEVLDEKGETGHLNFTLFHKNFRDINYDIYFDVNNYLVLNTSALENEDYYGRANVTGDVSISGYPGLTEIIVNAVTEDDTKLSIPLDDGGEAGHLDYIRFIPPKGERNNTGNDETLDEDVSGLKLEFQLTVNDNADVQIIFDEKIGDVIRVRGYGDLLLRIDNRGNFNMYGDYTMNGGDYLFTLQNVINKHFTVQPGSRITWSGAPTNAKVDLTAIYNLKAAPIDLTRSVGDTSDVYKRKLETDVYLKMKGQLLEPEISFDVDIPSLPETDIANQLLNPETTSEQDMNQQVFALLLARRFFSPSSGVSALSASQSTTYEMISNQFSNWVSQYFDDLDVRVNYDPGSNGAGQQTELAISKDFFNDKLLVEVNGSVQGSESGAEEQSNNFAGEFNIEYKINNEGSLRARAFNKANNYNPTNLNQSPYTQGLGLFYRVEFANIRELGRKVFVRDKKKKKETKLKPQKGEEEE